MVPAQPSECRPADVCVIGAGPVGQAVADDLALRGLRVVVLEVGSDLPSARANGDCPTEVLGDERYGDLGWKAWRALGGTSWAWGIDVQGQSHGVRLALLETPVIERMMDDLPRWPLTTEELGALQERSLAVSDLTFPCMNSSAGRTSTSRASRRPTACSPRARASSGGARGRAWRCCRSRPSSGWCRQWRGPAACRPSSTARPQVRSAAPSARPSYWLQVPSRAHASPFASSSSCQPCARTTGSAGG